MSTNKYMQCIIFLTLLFTVSTAIESDKIKDIISSHPYHCLSPFGRAWFFSNDGICGDTKCDPPFTLCTMSYLAQSSEEPIYKCVKAPQRCSVLLQALDGQRRGFIANTKKSEVAMEVYNEKKKRSNTKLLSSEESKSCDGLQLPPAFLVIPLNDCVNVHTKCCDWASSGECNKNPILMKKLCKQACGTCGCKSEEIMLCHPMINLISCKTPTTGSCKPEESESSSSSSEEKTVPVVEETVPVSTKSVPQHEESEEKMTTATAGKPKPIEIVTEKEVLEEDGEPVIDNESGEGEVTPESETLRMTEVSEQSSETETKPETSLEEASVGEAQSETSKEETKQPEPIFENVDRSDETPEVLPEVQGEKESQFETKLEGGQSTIPNTEEEEIEKHDTLTSDENEPEDDVMETVSSITATTENKVETEIVSEGYTEKKLSEEEEDTYTGAPEDAETERKSAEEEEHEAETPTEHVDETVVVEVDEQISTSKGKDATEEVLTAKPEIEEIAPPEQEHKAEIQTNLPSEERESHVEETEAPTVNEIQEKQDGQVERASTEFVPPSEIAITTPQTTPLPPGTATTTAMPIGTYGPPAGPLNNCPDLVVTCVFWASNGECEKNPFWMLPNCQKSCGSCGATVANVNLPKEKQDCDNRHELCQFWHSIGECLSNARYMLAHCPLSCRSCDSAFTFPLGPQVSTGYGS